MPFQIDGDAVGEVIRVSAVVRPNALMVNGVSVRGIQEVESADEDTESDQSTDQDQGPQITEGRITKDPQGA